MVQCYVFCDAISRTCDKDTDAEYYLINDGGSRAIFCECDRNYCNNCWNYHDNSFDCFVEGKEKSRGGNGYPILYVYGSCLELLLTWGTIYLFADGDFFGIISKL